MDCKLLDDTMMEIISRLSLKTFDTIRCTNKQFNKLTYESYILDLYKQKTNTISGFVTQTERRWCDYIKQFAPSPGSSSLDLSFLPREALILAASEQGILVYETPHPKILRNCLYYICKPATKKVSALPNPKTRYITVKLAIVIVGRSSMTLHYKILRLSRPKEAVLTRGGKLYSTHNCEIFDSKAWAWKLMDLFMLPFGTLLEVQQPIISGGSIYMSTNNGEIVKFDAYSEKWSVFKLPVSQLEYEVYESKMLIKYEGKIGFVCKPPNGSWEIWVIDKDESWEKIYVFEGKKDFERGFLQGLYDSDTSIVLEYDKLLFYKFKRDDKIDVLLGRKPHWMFPFRSDFEIINFKGKEKKRSNATIKNI